MILRDKKFTYILVVDYGVVRSTRMCRIDKKGMVQRGGIVDNRKLLQVMASKVKSNLKTKQMTRKHLQMCRVTRKRGREKTRRKKTL